MKTRTKQACQKCGAVLRSYWIGKDGLCNGCRNPHLVVTALTAMISVTEHPSEYSQTEKNEALKLAEKALKGLKRC